MRPPRILFIEAKVKAPVSPDQRLWLAALKDCEGANREVGVHLWRPADWPQAQAALS